MADDTYVVATIRPWNIKTYHEIVSKFPGHWVLITDPNDLTYANLQLLKPRYIFFPHWSSKVTSEIVTTFDCVCFHETDVPYGRGGSPIQNLIVRGHRETQISALKMVEDFDAGPVYLKQRLSLEGLAEEVFIRAAATIAEMIKYIVQHHPSPSPQQGNPVIFKRRNPDQSAIPDNIDSLEMLFDHLRMLDADGYPRAFLDCGRFHYEFSRPALKTDCIIADVTISIRKKGENRD